MTEKGNVGVFIIRVSSIVFGQVLHISINAYNQNITEVRDSATVGKKSGSEATSKRPRNETPSPLPAFKVQ